MRLRNVTPPTRFVRLLAALPGAEAVAQAAARTLAGSHHVGAAAVVLPREPDDGVRRPRVLLARHVFHDNSWGLPGGWVRRREDPGVACEREVLEELGLTVRAIEIVGCELHAVGGRPLRYGGLTLAYRCESVGSSDATPEPRSVELSDARWFAVEETAELVTPFERAMIARAVEAYQLR